jgi:hypothetical protein
MESRNPKEWRHSRKKGWRLRKAVWLNLARIAETSVHRYGKRCPPWLELDELKAQIVAAIPRLLLRMPDGFKSTSPRMTDTEYYIYCRASFAARQILSKQPRFTSELTDEKTTVDDSGRDRIEAKDAIAPYLETLSPTGRTIILLHYAGRRNEVIARYLARTVEYVSQTIRQVKWDLGITPEPDAEPHEFKRRLAA